MRPAGSLGVHYGPSSTCVSWKEEVHRSSEVRSQLQCPAVDTSLLPLMVSTLAVPDDLRHIANHGEQDWDPAYVIHLHPVATLRNLLPYTIRYLLEVCETWPGFWFLIQKVKESKNESPGSGLIPTLDDGWFSIVLEILKIKC